MSRQINSRKFSSFHFFCNHTCIVLDISSNNSFFKRKSDKINSPPELSKTLVSVFQTSPFRSKSSSHIQTKLDQTWMHYTALTNVITVGHMSHVWRSCYFQFCYIISKTIDWVTLLLPSSVLLILCIYYYILN